MFIGIQIVAILALQLLVCNCLNETQSKLLPGSEWYITELFNKFGSSNDSISLIEVQSLINDLSSTSTSSIDSKQQCFSAQDLSAIYDLNGTVSRSDFEQISPALVWLAVEKDCAKNGTNPDVTDAPESCKSSVNQKFLFGSITMVVIWVTSITSVFITSRFTKYRAYIILSLNALAIGTLLADALLHIIPKAIGMHEHAENEVKSIHHEEVENSPNDVAWKMFVVLATLFLLMLMDCFGGHAHSHEEEEETNTNSHCHDSVSPHKNDRINLDYLRSDEFQLNANIIESPDDDIGSNPPKNAKKIVVKKERRFWELFKGTGLIVFMANLIHKSADGLVIGAAFGESLSLGFSTALAVLFHEIPHELGDYGLLSTAGFRYWHIMILNSIGSFTALSSMLVISAVNPATSVREWIFAVTAGLFLYISLAGMIPRMKPVFNDRKKNGSRNWFSICLVIVFFWIGSVFMLCLSLYEDDIKIDVTGLCTV